MGYTYDNIGQWVDDLAQRPKIYQFQTYARLMRDKERRDAERAILDHFDQYNMHRGTKEATIINEDMAIVKYVSLATNDTHYIPVVQNKAAHYWFKTFESALLAAISILRTGNTDAAKYAGKILEVDM